MRSTYKEEDVEILLKDITGMVQPLPTRIRERYIQGGVHYCEMLPLEYKPTEKYLHTYGLALKNYARITADAIALMAEKLYVEKGEGLVVISLARAGIPIGILAHRYLKNKYGADIKHYAISIIRGRGIDVNALKYILERHDARHLQFLDGWVGKGAIFNELEKELEKYPSIDKRLAVVADPANITDLCGTHEDILIPSSCLNSTITGLLSRTFLKKDIIRGDDFHGAAFYEELMSEDQSNSYLKYMEDRFDYSITDHELQRGPSGKEIVSNIQKAYNISDINYIKPGIGETTRVLLRRVPWKIIVNEKYAGNDELEPIKQLANEKSVRMEVSSVPMGNYKVCGIIKNLADA